MGIKDISVEVLENACSQFDMTLDVLERLYEEGDIKFFSDKNSLVDWLYLGDAHDLFTFFEEASELAVEDFIGYPKGTTVLDIVLHKQNRIYVSDEVVVFCYI